MPKMPAIIDIAVIPALNSEHLPTKAPLSVGFPNSTFLTLPPGGKESDVLRHAELPIWTQQDCDNAYFQPIRDTFICAGFADGGKDACQVKKSLQRVKNRR